MLSVGMFVLSDFAGKWIVVVDGLGGLTSDLLTPLFSIVFSEIYILIHNGEGQLTPVQSREPHCAKTSNRHEDNKNKCDNIKTNKNAENGHVPEFIIYL